MIGVVKREATRAGTQDDILVVVNDSHGIYAPQVFCEKFSFHDFEGVDKEDWDIVLEGPEHEHYWDAWDNIMSRARIVLNPATLRYEEGEGVDLVEYYIEQEGDIFLVPEGVSIYNDDEEGEDDEE